MRYLLSLDDRLIYILVELAVVIGKEGRDYAPSNAMDYVAGNKHFKIIIVNGSLY